MGTLNSRTGAAFAGAAAIALCAAAVRADGGRFDCEYTIASNPPLAPAAGGPGSFAISTGAGCAWTTSAFTRFTDLETLETTEAPTTWVHLTTTSGTGPATIFYTVDPNPVSDTRSTYVGLTDVATGAPGFDWMGEAKVLLAQSGAAPASPPPAWSAGDVFAGLGSSLTDRGTYRAFTPAGETATVNGSDLHDPFASTPIGETGGVTVGCAVDPSTAHGDLWTSSWDGLRLSRFSDVTHQLTATLDISAAGLSSIQRRQGSVPVPQTTHDYDGFLAPDIGFSEQFVFAPAGEFYVGTSYYASDDHGLGFAYLLKFAKNDEGSIPGCGASGPCLLDWWRVDAGAEQPAGQSPAGAHAAWTKAWKDGYNSVGASEPESAKIAAAEAAVAPLASTVSYHPSIGAGQALPGTSGVDEIDLSSDGRIFYTSEDGYIRKFDPASGDQLPPIQITSADPPHPAIGGKAYGFRILPDGLGGADGGAGFIVVTALTVFRVDAGGRVLKPMNALTFDPPGGWVTGRPFALTLAPDAQSFWVATSQQNPLEPDPAGGKIYRFHIATQKLLAQFNPATSGDRDVQGLCAKLEYLAGVNRCYEIDVDGNVVLENGEPTPAACRRAAVCRGPGIDDTGQPNIECYAPGEVPLVLEPRGNFEGDVINLDLRPLTIGHRIGNLVRLPPDLSPVLDAKGDVVGITGAISYGVCAPEFGRADRFEDPDTVCATFDVGVEARDGASASFAWSIHHRNAPPAISSHDVVVLALSPMTVPTPATDADAHDSLIVRASARVYDAAHDTWIPGIAIEDYGMHLTSARGFPSAMGSLALAGTPVGHPLSNPSYPTVFEITLDLYDCNDALADTFTPSTDLASACFHHTATTFTVTVITNRAPVCSAASATPALVWPPNHTFVPFRIQGVTDADGDPLAITITLVTQDEPIDTTGDGRTQPDAIGVGTTSASVRAERAGKDGRLYQVDFSAADGNGGSCTGTVFIGVPHDQGRRSLPRDNGCRWNSTTGTPLTHCRSTP